MTVIVSGPMACGKTSNSGHLLRMFRALGVVDGWDIGDQIEPGFVHLTTCPPDEIRRRGIRCRVVRFQNLSLPGGRLKAPADRFRAPRRRVA